MQRGGPLLSRGESRGRRAQVSMEYLFLMGLVVFMVLPLIVLYYTQTAQLSDESAGAMASRAATQIAQAADTVYYLGEPSMRTLEVEFPDGIALVNVSGSSITLRMRSSHGDYDQSAWSAANLTGAINATPGPHTIVVSVLNDTVRITEG